VFETFETEDAAVRSFEQGTKAKGH
jgi:hypothetical protein